MKNQPTPESKDWEDMFDEYVNEIRRDLGPDREGKQAIYYFGCKDQIGNELFTIPDWGNIKRFIRSEKKKSEEKFRQEGYEVGFAQAETDSGMPKPMIEFIKSQAKEEMKKEIIVWAEKHAEKVFAGKRIYLTDLINFINKTI